MLVSRPPAIEANVLGNGGQEMRTSTRTFFGYTMLAILTMLAVLGIAMLF